MAKNATKPTTKKQTATKQGKPAPQVDKTFEEATTLAIKIHRRALKELEKH